MIKITIFKCGTISQVSNCQVGPLTITIKDIFI